MYLIHAEFDSIFVLQLHRQKEGIMANHALKFKVPPKCIMSLPLMSVTELRGKFTLIQ